MFPFLEDRSVSSPHLQCSGLSIDDALEFRTGGGEDSPPEPAATSESYSYRDPWGSAFRPYLGCGPTHLSGGKRVVGFSNRSGRRGGFRMGGIACSVRLLHVD